MFIKPVAVVHLDHAAPFLTGGGANLMQDVASPFKLITGTQQGQFSLINADFECRQISLQADVGNAWSFAIDSSNERIAIAHDSMITVATIDGKTRTQFEPPKLDSNATKRFQREFSGCYFDLDNSLWCVAGTSERSLVVQLRDPDNGTVKDQCTLNDPLGSSAGSFYPTPDRNTVALWITAGQDGQIINWLNKLNGVTAVEESQLKSTTRPEYSASGEEFLVRSIQGDIYRYGFPDVVETGRCSGKSLEDDGFGSSLARLDDQNGLVRTFEGRLFRIDLQSMTLADEVKLDLPDGVTKDASGASYFRPVGDLLVFVCQREKQPKWKDSLVIYRAVDFLKS